MMSVTVAASVELSGDINGYRSSENPASAQRVPARLDGPPADEVHLASKEIRKFSLHSRMLEQPPLGVWGKGYEKIHILSGGRVDQHRSKKLEFDNTPPPAELIQLSLVHGQPLQDGHLSSG